VPKGKLRKALMHGAHDALVAGHLGFKKAYERLRQGVTWPEKYSKLKAYVRSCDSCQRNKTSNQKPNSCAKAAIYSDREVRAGEYGLYYHLARDKIES
jgi:peptidyl-tRNA hydrolase